jgi:hypothetical protein
MYIVRFRLHLQGGELLASVLVLARWRSIGEQAFDVGVLPAIRTLLPVVPTGVAVRHGALDLAVETASIQGAGLGWTGRQSLIVPVAA